MSTEINEDLPWQPIDTAPKNIVVLLRGPSWVSCGRWDENKYAKTPKPYWTSDLAAKSFGVHWQRKNQPTHFLKLFCDAKETT